MIEDKSFEEKWKRLYQEAFEAKQKGNMKLYEELGLEADIMLADKYLIPTTDNPFMKCKSKRECYDLCNQLHQELMNDSLHKEAIICEASLKMHIHLTNRLNELRHNTPPKR